MEPLELEMALPNFVLISKLKITLAYHFPIVGQNTIDPTEYDNVSI